MARIHLIAAVACAGTTSNAGILSTLEGGAGGRLAVTPFGAPFQGDGMIDDASLYSPDFVGFSFDGTDLNLSEVRNAAADFGNSRGWASATSTVAITRSSLEMSNLGGAFAVADQQDGVSRQNARVTYTAGVGTYIVLAPFVEYEIVMTVNLGERSSDSYGFTRSTAVVDSSNVRDDEVILTLDSRNANDPTTITHTFTGRSEQYTELLIQTQTEILVWGSEIGGVPTYVEGAGSSVSLRIIPSPGTVGFLAFAPLIWSRRRR